MMYLVGETGQLGNQLFRLAHHVGNSLQYEYPLTCPVFQYGAYFPNLSSHPLLHVSQRGATWQRKLTKAVAKSAARPLVSRALNTLGVQIVAEPYVFSEADTQFIQAARRRPVLVTSWLFRDYGSFRQNADRIRYLFRPDAQYARQAERLLLPLQQKNVPIIGVHIRRGDYKDWEGGRYYFDDGVYRAVMAHLLTLPGLHNATFLLCSNEPVDAHAFSDLPVVESVGNHFMTDLTLLSGCSYVVGPPSTFSAWASFMGQVPMYHVTAATDRPALTDFRVDVG